jgi:hypothetical protein
MEPRSTSFFLHLFSQRKAASNTQLASILLRFHAPASDKSIKYQSRGNGQPPTTCIGRALQPKGKATASVLRKKLANKINTTSCFLPPPTSQCPKQEGDNREAIQYLIVDIKKHVELRKVPEFLDTQDMATEDRLTSCLRYIDDVDHKGDFRWNEAMFGHEVPEGVGGGKNIGGERQGQVGCL